MRADATRPPDMVLVEVTDVDRTGLRGYAGDVLESHGLTGRPAEPPDRMAVAPETSVRRVLP